MHPAITAHPARRGLRVLVTPDPTAVRGPACTPELAAWLIVAGHAVALVDEHAGDRRQWLHLAPPAHRPTPSHPAPAGRLEPARGGR